MRYVILGLLLLLVVGFGQSVVYNDVYVREPNITLDYNTIPWVLRGITPSLSKPNQFKDDMIILLEEPVRLDPRTCPGEMAICYQVREHSFSGNITFGANYTAASSYIFPDLRVKYRYCVGGDLDCVRESTNCFCLRDDVQEPEPMYGMTSSCSDEFHVCRDSYASLTLCEGALGNCSKQYDECGCGRYSACRANSKNVCINGRKEIYMCQADMFSCLKKYDSCFCGEYMMKFQNPCMERRHACERDGEEKICMGEFTDCALLNDKCTCGVA